jgi:hypothetical protein
MEEYFYIILLIIWVVVSLFKKNKAKQKQAAPQPKSQESQAEPAGDEIDLEQMLEEYLGGGTKKPRPAPVESRQHDNNRDEKREYSDQRRDDTQPVYASQDDIPRSVYGEDSMPEDMDDMYQGYQEELGVKEDFEFSAEGEVQTIEDLIRSHARKDALLQAQAEMEERRMEAEGELPPFDLRTAVVFSEILNRKYN